MDEERTKSLLELLRIMKDLQGDGFRLTKEINATIKYLLGTNGITKEIIDQVYQNTITADSIRVGELKLK